MRAVTSALSLTARGVARLLVALAPFAVTCALLALSAGDAASAPAARAAAAADAARDALAADAIVDAKLDARSEAGAAALSDARLDARLDAPADAVRPDAVAREGGWFPDADRPIAADPSPLLSDTLFVLTVTFAKGAITVDKVEREKLPSKQAVVRRFGRFAAELYSGPTLLERVRFDFPLIADDDYAGDVYARGLVTSVKVRIPDSDRPNKLEIWDRATDRRWSFEYPPKLTP